MIRSLLFFTIFTLLLGVAEAGISDSLMQRLPELKGKEKADVLNRLARLNVRNEQEKAFEFGNEAMELSLKLNYQEGVATALLHMSTAHYYLSDYTQAIDYLEQSLEIREKMQDSVMINDALNKIGANYRFIGKYEESLNYLFRSLRISDLLKDSLKMAGVFNNIGIVYRHLADFEKALDYYTRSYEIYTRLNHLRGIAQLSNNIGIIYRWQGEYEKAMEFYQRSLNIDLKLGNQREVAQSYINIGAMHMHMSDFPKAIDALERALGISRNINNLDSQSTALMHLGNVFSEMNRYNQAVQYYEEALNISRMTGNLQRQDQIIIKLAETSRIMGDYRSASNYFTELTQLRDSLHHEQIRARVSEVEEKYEFDKKLQEIETLKQENKIQELKLNENRILTYSFAGLTFTMLVIALLLIQRYRLRTKQQNAELEQKLFRTQMNPHFIFNSLNAIQSFIYKNDAPEAGKYLSNFARLIRLVLSNSREEFITLENEIRTLDYYLQLQRLRYNYKFDYNFTIDNALHKELILIPPMLAQPFIENSIEHGIQHISQKGIVDISFMRNGDSIIFKIADNGVGINQSKLNTAMKNGKHESLALSITEERLKLLNRSTPQKIELKIEEINPDNKHAKGTLITFSIPFRTVKDRKAVYEKHS